MKRVLIIQSDHLLGAGVESLLTREIDLHVMSTVFNTETTLWEEMESFHPDVVVFDGSLCISSSSTVFHLIKESSQLRVLIVMVDENRIRILDKREISVQHAADLILAIQ